tara:strand:- start:336 stop:836 length:501 start_codon:yes stop_codon:yes gene_type:complete
MAINYGDGSTSNNGRVIQQAFADGSGTQYNFSNGSYTELDNSFRCSFTPEEVGNKIIIAIMGNVRVNGSNLFSLLPIMHTSTGGNESLFAEQDAVGGGNRAHVLNNQQMGESYRHSTSYIFWNSSLWASFTVANIETHTLKLFGKGTAQLGDNTPKYMMMMTEHVA